MTLTLDRYTVSSAKGEYMRLESDVGQRLSDARERAGLSVTQVAATLGVSKSVVCQWQDGLNIPEARIGQMAELYGVSVHWLKTGQPAGDVSGVVAMLERSPIPPEGRARILALVESLAAA